MFSGPFLILFLYLSIQSDKNTILHTCTSSRLTLFSLSRSLSFHSSIVTFKTSSFTPKLCLMWWQNDLSPAQEAANELYLMSLRGISYRIILLGNCERERELETRSLGFKRFSTMPSVKCFAKQNAIRKCHKGTNYYFSILRTFLFFNIWQLVIWQSVICHPQVTAENVQELWNDIHETRDEIWLTDLAVRTRM